MIRAFLILLAALMTMPALAHQQKVTISTIAHNPRSGMLEVVHSIPLHDAEHALRAQGMRAPDIINDLESRRVFARYVAARFSVELDNAPIALTLLGTEIEGGRLIVYQEATSPGPGSELMVRSQILSDVWARQENRVNLGNGTQVDTLIFANGDPARSAILP